MKPPASTAHNAGRAELELADGARVTIRPVQAGDKRLIADAFAELSEDSRYQRFFTPLRQLDAAQLAYLTEVDQHDHEALLAIEPRSGACVGVARFSAAVLAENRDAIGLIERLGETTREETGEVLGLDVALPDTGAGPTLRGLLRAAAAGLLAPAGAFLRRRSPADG